MKGGSVLGKYLITPGDFLKNAGISGMEYMLKMSGARENKIGRAHV